MNFIDKRLKEAEKLGFKTCLIPENNKKLLKESYKLDIIGMKNINDAMKKLGLKWPKKGRSDQKGAENLGQEIGILILKKWPKFSVTF